MPENVSLVKVMSLRQMDESEIKDSKLLSLKRSVSLQQTSKQDELENFSKLILQKEK